MIAGIFGVEINHNQSQQSTSSVYLFLNRSEYWTFPVEVVALWVNRKPNKEFDLQMTGSQEVLFWYERTIISLQCFINLICRKYFRIQASTNRGSERSNKRATNEVNSQKLIHQSNIHQKPVVSAHFDQVPVIKVLIHFLKTSC